MQPCSTLHVHSRTTYVRIRTKKYFLNQLLSVSTNHLNANNVPVNFQSFRPVKI